LILCYGDLESVTCTNSGVVAPYINYLEEQNTNTVWYNNSINSPIDPLLLPAGIYNLLVTDDNDTACYQIENYVVLVPDSIILSIATTDVSCFGGNDGTAIPTITGGTPITTDPDTYNAVNWGLLVNPSNLTAGDYYVSVTDANFCSSEVVTYTISEPTELFIDSVVTTLVSCDGADNGTATVFGSGGTPGALGYNY